MAGRLLRPFQSPCRAAHVHALSAFLRHASAAPGLAIDCCFEMDIWLCASAIVRLGLRGERECSLDSVDSEAQAAVLDSTPGGNLGGSGTLGCSARRSAQVVVAPIDSGLGLSAWIHPHCNLSYCSSARPAGREKLWLLDSDEARVGNF